MRPSVHPFVMRSAGTGRLHLLAVSALCGLALAACATGDDAARRVTLSVSSSDLPPVPICRAEMRAYVELTKLAKLHGDGWRVFEPAVDALKQQILDCLGDNNAEFRPLSLRQQD
jgi:hypothetical protein